jgi:tetratricopeptide repeat protein 8
MEPRMLLGIARIHDMLNDPEKAIGFYKKVLILDASNVESIACLGAHYFYADQAWSRHFITFNTRYHSEVM